MCNTIGIGNIRVRMFDGQVRILTNVRYVPNLKKNPLLLGDMEARGYKFSSADGGIKVTKGSMMILKEKRIENLYKLAGSIIIGDASAAIEKEDITRFWHMRLRHMSERGLQALHKRSALPDIKYCNLIFVKFSLWVAT